MKGVWKEMNGPDIDPNDVIFEKVFQDIKQDLFNEEMEYWEECNEQMLEEIVNNEKSITCMNCFRDTLIIETVNESNTFIHCKNNCGLNVFVNVRM